jgi:hypothetical protein
MEAPMATPTGSGDVGRIEHEIAQVRDDLGRTVAEIGTRLTPSHLMEQAKQSLKDATADKTRAVAQSATTVATEIASRTRDAALDARDRVQAHPLVAGLAGAGIGAAVWAISAAMRDRKRLVPREWDEPFDRSSRRMPAGFAAWGRTDRLLPLVAAAAAAWVIWQSRAAAFDEAFYGDRAEAMSYEGAPDYRLE